MNKFNIAFGQVLNFLLICLLLLLAVGFVFRLIESFQLENENVSTEWTGVLFGFIIVVEFYLLIIFGFFRIVYKRKMKEMLKFILLLLIFIFGVLPALLSLYPAFLKS